MDARLPRVSTTISRQPSSVILAELLVEAPGQQVALDWLMSRLGDRSFGMILLIIAPLGLLPGISVFIGILLIIPAYQMMLGRPGPIFPRAWALRKIEVRRLAALLRRVVPVLRYLERFIRPRWTMPFQWTKRIVGIVVLLLSLGLFVPVPMSNIPPALTILLIAFAYLEEDGVLLCLALTAAPVLLALAAAVTWQALGSAGWVPGLL
jgi:hypothetical protein